MLDDAGGRLAELADDLQGGVEVEQVVVRQLLAVQGLGGGERGGGRLRLDVKGGSLVGVFAVTQRRATLELQCEPRGKIRVFLARCEIAAEIEVGV